MRRGPRVFGRATRAAMVLGSLAATALAGCGTVLRIAAGSSVPTGGGCPAIGYSAPATIFLSQPLGARPLVDVAWGRILTPR